VTQSQHHQQQEQHWGIITSWSQLLGVLQGGTFSQSSTGHTGSAGSTGSTGSTGRTGRGAVQTPSGCRWQVAAGDVPGYESVSYVPPEVRCNAGPQPANKLAHKLGHDIAHKLAHKFSNLHTILHTNLHIHLHTILHTNAATVYSTWARDNLSSMACMRPCMGWVAVV
jgi:hypothetical protein